MPIKRVGSEQLIKHGGRLTVRQILWIRAKANESGVTENEILRRYLDDVIERDLKKVPRTSHRRKADPEADGDQLSMTDLERQAA